MTATAQEQNASMEEILHSIRKIIANEPLDMNASSPATNNSANPEDVLELTEVVSQQVSPEPETPEQEPAAKDVLSDIDAVLGTPVEATDSTPDPFAQPVTQTPSATPQEKSINHGLISGSAAEASARAIKELLDKMPKPKIDSPMFRSGATLEELVVETLRPVLSEWLDKNLPMIVQQLVEKEIRKLIPRD